MGPKADIANRERSCLLMTRCGSRADDHQRHGKFPSRYMKPIAEIEHVARNSNPSMHVSWEDGLFFFRYGLNGLLIK